MAVNGTRPRDFIREVTLPNLPAITVASNANPVSLTSAAHGLATGQVVTITGATGAWAAINGTFTVTVTGVNTFTIPVDSTAFGVLAGAPIFGIWIHVQAQRECRVVELFLKRSDPNPQVVLWKHQSDADAFSEELQPNERGVKNSWSSHFKMLADLPYRIRLNDTIGFFRNTVSAAATTLVIKEITDPALDVNSGTPNSPFAGAQV